jgi:hypothetical protein
MNFKMNLKSRSLAATVHLGISLLIAALAALLVFKVWYPYPYSAVSGGRELFLLIVTVDVILGPLLTFAVFNRAKARHELLRDIAVIGLLQMAALIYGLWTMAIARPVYLVHEVDRFQVVTAVDVDEADLREAPPELRKLPWFGVQTIGVRKARDNDEMMKSIDLAMAGKDAAMRPGWWQALSEDNWATMRQRGKPLTFVRQRAGNVSAELDSVVRAAGLSDDQVIALPLMARTAGWAVLLDKRDLRIIGYLPIDLF